jgi:hypothetical protein
MQTRESLILSTAVVVAALILGAFFGPRTEAQKGDPSEVPVYPKAGPAAVGRYQALHVGDKSFAIVLVDTATGQCWTNLVDPPHPGLQVDRPWQSNQAPEVTA